MEGEEGLICAGCSGSGGGRSVRMMLKNINHGAWNRQLCPRGLPSWLLT